MGTFHSSLGGQAGSWVGLSKRARCLPHHPIGTSHLLALQPSVWEVRTDSAGSFAQTGTLRLSRAHNPRTCPLPGDRMESPTHWGQDEASEAGSARLA